jgi:predicted RNase H-like HicB family nuclease
MSADSYRLLVIFDNEKKKFVARIPELPDLQVEGESRAEAVAKAEEALEEAFRKAASDGTEMPAPFDQTEFTGELTLKVTPTLHRELAFLARHEGVDLNQLVSELLAASVAGRAAPRTGGHRREEHFREGREGNNRRRPPRGQDYFNIMEDKASFIDYVRKLDSGGGPNRRGGRGRDK